MALIIASTASESLAGAQARRKEKTMSFLWTRRGLWNRAAVLFFALALLAVLSPRAMAQAVAVVELDGHVTDPTGQAIVGAQVKITETGKREVHTAVTDNTGRFALQELPPGAYRLDVSFARFKSYVQTGITLQVDSSLHIALETGKRNFQPVRAWGQFL